MANLDEPDEVPDGVPIRGGKDGVDWISWDVYAHSQDVDGGAQRWAWFTQAPEASCQHTVESVWKSGVLECMCGEPIEVCGAQMDDGY